MATTQRRDDILQAEIPTTLPLMALRSTIVYPLGTIAVHRVCPLSHVTAVLTDHQASPEVVEALAGAGCTVLLGTNPEE